MIDFTLSVQVSHGYQLLFARENDSCESCLKSSSQICTFAMLSLKNRRDQQAVVRYCFLLEYLPTQMYALIKTAYRNNVLSCATMFCWYAFFAMRRASTAALLRSNRPKTHSREIMVKTVEATKYSLPLKPSERILVYRTSTHSAACNLQGPMSDEHTC